MLILSGIVRTAVEGLVKVTIDNSPVVLTTLASIGVAGTAIAAVKATPQALSLIAEDKEYQGDGADRTFWDDVKVGWRCYIPAAMIGVATIGCVWGANAIHMRRNTILVALYSLAEKAGEEYRAKVLENLGEKKEAEIRESISQDKINNNPVHDNQIIYTGKGNVLFFDCVSGRYFESDIQKVRRIINDVNEEVIQEGFMSLNQFYARQGLDPIEIGYDMGWTQYHQMKASFDSKITDDDRPCIVLTYQVFWAKDGRLV